MSDELRESFSLKFKSALSSRSWTQAPPSIPRTSVRIG